MNRDMTHTERHKLTQSEDGQTIVLSVLFLVVLLGFAALVIDGGSFMLSNRNLQGAADSAAMAGIRDLPSSSAEALATAESYAKDKNTAQDDVQTVAAQVNGIDELEVTVTREASGHLINLLGIGEPTIAATATARLNTFNGGMGMLPVALMEGEFTMGEPASAKFDSSATGNHGVIAPTNTPGECDASNGANDIANLIRGEFAAGGLTSCTYAVGETVPTEPGNLAGQARQGFNDRIPDDNTESFDDVFEWDPELNRYLVKLPDSPRLTFVPVTTNIDGTTEWPNGASEDIEIVSYVMAYIGYTGPGDEPECSGGGGTCNTHDAIYPPYSHNGKRVWIVPVEAVLPQDFSTGELGDYDPDSSSPLMFRLVE